MSLPAALPFSPISGGTTYPGIPQNREAERSLQLLGSFPTVMQLRIFQPQFYCVAKGRSRSR